ncbi:lysin A [Microbacterium phage Hiddenleaf]|nr:lysin A [Microbacterium phage Hiddenleaf]QNJ55656.1 lysin A [Microbacterium phage FreddieHg]QNN98516.1 lysin A [Microbacterium phage Chivey]
MTDPNSLLQPEDREIILAALRDWQQDGVERPLIPMDVDVDGDGIVDAWGLDSFGNLIVVSGIDLKETVYVADGSDIVPTDDDDLRGAESWVFRDGQRLTPAMAQDFDALNAEFHQRTGHWLRVRSGVRTDAEHLAIWYDRYTRTPNGRRVYDTRWWNGVPWYRVSPAGTVAVPGTSNHQINLARGQRGALDIYDTGSDAGVLTRGSFRARVFDEIAGKYGYDSEGYNFAEPWHKRYNRDPWRAVSGGGNNTPAKSKEDDMTVAILLAGRHYFTVGEEFISHNGTQAQADITRNVNSAQDELHKLNHQQFVDYLDGMGIPRSVVNGDTGAVLNPQTGKMEGNGVWSRRREAVALEEANARKLDELLKLLKTPTTK